MSEIHYPQEGAAKQFRDLNRPYPATPHPLTDLGRGRWFSALFPLKLLSALTSSGIALGFWKDVAVSNLRGVSGASGNRHTEGIPLT